LGNAATLIPLAGVPRVAHVAYFEPFAWLLVVSEEREAFYASVVEIVTQSAVILAIVVAGAAVLLLVFVNALTRPLRMVVDGMSLVLQDGDLSARVPVQYKDETGRLAHTFNLMNGELERAYEQIKGYALKAVVAQQQEKEIRNIFQRYVPADVIDQFFEKPESMLVGQDRDLAVLFSDIRSFTSISERLTPGEVVQSLNAYFEQMVDAVTAHGGIVDKYIGDAIMAFFGAPVAHEDDALRSVEAALEMLDRLEDFNRRQAEEGRPPFRIGLGINFGAVTVGNIGSDKKMDYTVIGDMVNLASRLQDLTKTYGLPLLVSDNVRKRVGDAVPWRLVDQVAVKGRSGAALLYTTQRNLTEEHRNAWGLYVRGLRHYYKREFVQAGRNFAKTAELLPGGRPAAMFQERCQRLIATPPPADWNGVEEMLSK
jgi:adenylate cyclase